MTNEKPDKAPGTTKRAGTNIRGTKKKGSYRRKYIGPDEKRLGKIMAVRSGKIIFGEKIEGKIVEVRPAKTIFGRKRSEWILVDERRGKSSVAEKKAGGMFVEVREVPGRGKNYISLQPSPYDVQPSKLEEDLHDRAALSGAIMTAQSDVSIAHEKIAKHQGEIEHLKKETRTVLAKIRATLNRELG